MQVEDVIIVSVDHDAVEPPQAFIRQYPENTKDLAPKIVDKSDKDVWLWNGKIFPTIGLNAVVGRPRAATRGMLCHT